MYARVSITIGDVETESTTTCEYKESDRCNVGGCLAEAFAPECSLGTLADLLFALTNHDGFVLNNVESARLAQALTALKGD